MPDLSRRRLCPTARTLSCLLLQWLVCGAVQAAVADDVRSLLARGDPAGALQLAQQAAATQPRDAEAGFLLGVVLMDLRRDEEALAAFTTLSQLYPELPEPLNNIALLHVRGGRLAEALPALQAALRNAPDNRTARVNLGELHLMLAVQAWEQASAKGGPDAPLQRRLETARALLAR